MNLKNEFAIVGGALSNLYDSSGQILRAFTRIQQAYEAKAEQVDALEDMDEIRGHYQDLAKVAIHTVISVEEEAAINYGRGDELLKKLEELDG